MRATVPSVISCLAVVALVSASREPIAAADGKAGKATTVRLWPGKAPGETRDLPPEVDINKPTDRKIAGRPIIKLANVSTPTLAVYRPEKGKDTGASVIICPGGGHHILAYDLEGTEVAEWLTSVGVTAIVLKYRVPAREKERRWRAAVQDAQRAVSVVRSNAREWGLDPARVGILGFSAGGQTAALTAIFGEKRTYERADSSDEASCRPDFAILIYPAYLVEKANPTKLVPEVVVSKETPPMFFAHAHDDPVTPLSSVMLYAELKKAGVAAELHIYEKGGHGYGLRKTALPVTSWPERCQDWLRSSGLLEARGQ